jgi:hypothetical protein
MKESKNIINDADITRNAEKVLVKRKRKQASSAKERRAKKERNAPKKKAGRR